MIAEVMKGTTRDQIANNRNNPLREIKQHVDLLNVVQCDQGQLLYKDYKLIPPVGARDKILRNAHIGHWGWATILENVSSCLCWPNMKTQIIGQCQQCKACSTVAKMKRYMEPIIPLKVQAFSVGELWSSDVFSLGGKNYMVAIDKVSGMVFASIMKNLKAETATEILENWISMLGLPSVLKTDGATN